MTLNPEIKSRLEEKGLMLLASTDGSGKLWFKLVAQDGGHVLASDSSLSYILNTAGIKHYDEHFVL